MKRQNEDSLDRTRRGFLRHAVTGALVGAATHATSEACEPDRSNRNVGQPQQGPAAPYPFFRAAGDHRSLGRQHGEQAADRIKAHLDYIASSLKLSRAEMRRRALRFKPMFERYCPHLVVEIEGLAEGAGVTLADGLAVNIRSALKKGNEGGCTAFAVRANATADGEILCGQNSDTFPEVVDLGYVLNLKPLDKPEILMWTFGGMIGYHGINDQGVAHFANDFGGGPKPRFGMPHYPLKRLMFECARVDEVVDLFRRVPLWANGNYVLCDGAGSLLDIEATPEGFELVPCPEDGVLVHTNHFVSPRYATAENHRQSRPDSFRRQKRLETLIRPRIGSLSIADMQRFLRDRDGAPCAICRSGETTEGSRCRGITVASIVAQPASRRMHIATGNHPDAPFVTYTMGS